jgi:hypothetical protein
LNCAGSLAGDEFPGDPSKGRKHFVKWPGLTSPTWKDEDQSGIQVTCVLSPISTRMHQRKKWKRKRPRIGINGIVVEIWLSGAENRR